MVIGRLWRFMKRHRGKIFTFGALTAGKLPYDYSHEHIDNFLINLSMLQILLQVSERIIACHMQVTTCKLLHVIICLE